MLEERTRQKHFADKGAVESRQYQPGEAVLLQHHIEKTWKPAKVVLCTDGIRSYAVTDGEQTWRRNSHHLRPIKAAEYVDNLRLDQDQEPTSTIATDDGVAQRVAIPEAGPPGDIQQRTTRSGRVVKSRIEHDFEYY